MKKFLIYIIVLLLINIPKVNAEIEWTDIPQDGNAKTEVRYMWYEEELIDNGYINLVNNKNITFDKSDYIFEYGNWKDYNGENIQNIETRTIYQYKQLYKTRYIQIYDAKNNPDDLDFYIDEIKVYLNNQEISYDKKCSMCYQVTLDNINDGTTENKFKMYTYNGYLMIDLVKYYDIKDLKIEIVLSQNGKFKIGFSKYNVHRTSLTAYKEFEINAVNPETFAYNVDKDWEINFNYSETKKSEEKIEENFDIQITPIEQYRTVNTLYHSYFINKKYYDDNYYANSPDLNINLMKDENKYKVFYQYNTNNDNNITEVITKTKTIYKDSEPITIYKTIENKSPKILQQESNEKIIENTKTFFKNESIQKIKTVKTNNTKPYLILFIIIILLLIIERIILRKILHKKMSYEKYF